MIRQDIIDDIITRIVQPIVVDIIDTDATYWGTPMTTYWDQSMLSYWATPMDTEV